MIYGLGLSDDVLEKVYHRNAEDLFARFKGAELVSGRGISGDAPAGVEATK